MQRSATTYTYFNPPAPHGAGGRGDAQHSAQISIHPPRAGRDKRRWLTTACLCRFQSTRPVRGGTPSLNSLARRTLYFNPPAPCGAGLWAGRSFNHPKSFQSTRPVRGGTPIVSMSGGHLGISIHPPRAGRDRLPVSVPGQVQDFNPPAPCGAGHVSCSYQSTPDRFQSTRPVRGGTIGKIMPPLKQAISIHPPRAGRDAVRWLRVHGRAISIHPPRAGRDENAERLLCNLKVFQSTRPVRGGTSLVKRSSPTRYYFNPPAPCGAGQQSCTKFIPCILAQYTIQRAAKLLSAYQQAYFC